MSTQSDRKTETIPQWKREEVEEIVAFLGRYDSVGVVDITGIPSRQLQEMRRDLHGTAELRVSRNTLLERALAADDDGLEELVGFVSGQVGLIGTSDNPFGLYQQLEASKTSAPINAGETAPSDIVVPEGDTGIDPGPFVGDLQTVGASARIEDGSIKVLEDSTVLEAGGEVSADLSNVLSELGIEPKEVGLDLRGVYADGTLFEPADLELDVEEYRRDVSAGAARARTLAMEASYPTAQTVPALLATASTEGTNLALHAAVEDPDVVPDLVGKADSQVRALAARIDDEEALPAELQDVADPLEETDETDTGETDADESDDDQPAEGADADADADEDGDGDDDGGDAGDALGDMFGD
ncbi:MAG: 50S ribosomal protein L10 [Haloarculaceae archaeon]